MICPGCNSNVSLEELDRHRRKHALERFARMTPSETEERRIAIQALCDLEDLRGKYPGF